MCGRTRYNPPHARRVEESSSAPLLEASSAAKGGLSGAAIIIGRSGGEGRINAAVLEGDDLHPQHAHRPCGREGDRVRVRAETGHLDAVSVSFLWTSG